MTGLWIAAFVALWALVVVLGLLVLGTLRRLAPLIERVDVSLHAAATDSIRGLQPGATPSPFMAESIDGLVFTEVDLRGSTTVVLFLGSTCGACERLAEDLESGSVPGLGARLLVVADRLDWAHALAGSAQVTVLVDEHRSLARAFETRVVPQAFVVDEHGTVLAGGRTSDWDGIRDLLASVAKGGGRESDVTAAVVAS